MVRINKMDAGNELEREREIEREGREFYYDGER